MQYLIILGKAVFYTNWFDAENNFAEGMTVINLLSHKYMTDGKTWIEIEEDHL